MDKGYDWLDSCFSELKRIAKQMAEKEVADNLVKERFLKRFMYGSLREAGCALRMLQVNKTEEEEKEKNKMKRHRGIMNRILDVNARLMSMGYNKLIEEYKIYMDTLKNRLKFVIKALTDQDLKNAMTAYNMLKERKRMCDGVGVNQAEQKKKHLIKSLMDSGYALQKQAARGLKSFLLKEKAKDKDKANLLKRMMDKGLRQQGQALRMLKVYKDMAMEKEQQLALKQRGVCKMMLDKNIRLMHAGLNKLRDEYRNVLNGLKDKLKFVIKALTDTDANFTLMAYNSLKRNRDAQVNGHDYRVKHMKENFIKRILNKSYNLMFMAMQNFNDFMEKCKNNEELKKKCAIRMSSSGNRLMGQALRQLQVWSQMAADDEERLHDRQKGVCKRMLDQNVRLMGMAWVNLYDHYQARQEKAKEKVKWIIQCIRSQDLMFVQMAYQAMKTQALMMSGVGLSDAEHKKGLLIRRLRDTTLNLSLCAIQSLKEFLKEQRGLDEWAEAEAKRLEEDKKKAIKLMMNKNLRLMFAGFNQLWDHTTASKDAEQKLAARQRGIAKRIFSSQTRLMAQAMNSLKDFSNKDDKVKKRTIMRIMDVNYRNMAGGWRMLMHFNEMMINEEQKLENYKKNVIYRMTDKAHNLCASAMKLLIKWNDKKKTLQKSMILRMVDSNFRLQGMAMNQLQAFANQTKNMQISFAKRLLNSSLNLMAAGFRTLKENSRMLADGAEKLKKKQNGIIMRMMNSGYRLMGGCLVFMKNWNRVMAEQEAREDGMIKGFINRMMNANLRLCGMALNNLKQHNTQCNQDADRNERLMKRFIGFCCNANYRLLLAGNNKLLEHYNQ